MGYFDKLLNDQDSQTEQINESFTVGGPSGIGSTGGIGGFQSGAGFEALAGATGIGFEGNFVGDSFYDTGGIYGRNFNNPGLLEIEKSYIMHQRAIALYPEVAIGIEEIMRDLFDKKDPFKISVPENPGETLDDIQLTAKQAQDIQDIQDTHNNKDKQNIHESKNTKDSKSYEKIIEIFDQFKKHPFTILNYTPTDTGNTDVKSQQFGGTKTPDSLVIFNFLKQAYIDGTINILSVEVDQDLIATGTSTRPNAPDYITNPGSSNSLVPKDPSMLLESMVYWNNDNNKVSLEPGTIREKDLVTLLESENKKKSKNSNKSNKSNNSNKPKARVFIPLDPLRVIETDRGKFYQFGAKGKIRIDPENLIESDFGLFDVVGARHGFLLYAFKYANQLQALQDMLIPMRFRRSVARRVFNVDISNLPQNRAVSYMRDLQEKFKYKKTYDAKSGKIISKIGDPTGIVEDYWFANRSGSKGTTVETIDEAGNFQDSLDDISYFNKKLYQSMFIPLRRIFESDASYDYTANSIEIDELRFVNFLDRVRFVFDSVLTKMFHQILKDQGFSDDNIKEVTVSINFEDWYGKAKVKEDFDNGLDLFEKAKPYIGKLISAETALEKIFGMTIADVSNEYSKLANEILDTSPYLKVHTFLEKNSEEEGY